ncbi:MAG: alpha-L-fucosidase [Maribacter stanieri]
MKKLSIIAFTIILSFNLGAQDNVVFEPTWESLSQYETPEWFRDVKFGIWAHWGPQSEPGYDDWYARNMYIEKSAQYNFNSEEIKLGTETNSQYRYHLDHYGHPSEFGFKDVINEWKAEKFDADALISLYKDCGAKYFMAMANHHENFDTYNSKYQPWNAVNVGPKKDILGEWATAARKYGLRFGASVHSSHAWSWYETSQGSDTEGPYAGIPYDGHLTKKDGKGKWWEGLDPQDLYAQNHTPSKTHLEWSWDPERGSSVPDKAYMEKYYNRVVQLWDDYDLDQIYFDDFVLPFYEIDSTLGLKLAAHFYNESTRENGKNEAIMNTKMLSKSQQEALTYDIERSKASGILEKPWQTDHCIGRWHYDKEYYYKHKYQPASEIIDMLVDIVSKNGNLMLNLPLRGDGTLDTDATKIIKEIGAWLKVNGEAIYETRPWEVYGEGPSTEEKEINLGGVYGRTGKTFSAKDIRFTRSKDNTTIYAIGQRWPESGHTTIRSLSSTASTAQNIKEVSLIGHEGKVKWEIDSYGLQVKLPKNKTCSQGFALRIIKK